MTNLPVLREDRLSYNVMTAGCWQSQPRGNGLAKVPVRPNKQRATVNNPDHWSDFESVWNVYQSDGFSGLFLPCGRRIGICGL